VLALRKETDAMAPLSASAVSELLASHHQPSKDRTEVEVLIHRLAPVWVEMRTVLNELNRVLVAPSWHQQDRLMERHRSGVSSPSSAEPQSALAGYVLVLRRGAGVWDVGSSGDGC
jgi:hypothetical protein